MKNFFFMLNVKKKLADEGIQWKHVKDKCFISSVGNNNRYLSLHPGTLRRTVTTWGVWAARNQATNYSLAVGLPIQLPAVGEVPALAGVRLLGANIATGKFGAHDS